MNGKKSLRRALHIALAVLVCLLPYVNLAEAAQAASAPAELPQQQPQSPPNMLYAATFVVDITPALGEGACIGFMPTVASVEHPLQARGLILRHGTQTWALVALDIQGLCNTSYDRIRQRLANAIGTTANCVAVQSLHQHTAPVLDNDAALLLHFRAPRLLGAHLGQTELVAARLSRAAGQAVPHLQPVTQVIATKAQVHQVASNRRVPQSNGEIRMRGSATKEPELHAAPEGLIDPWLRTLTFARDASVICQLHYYATHPQTFYGDARITWDLPGMARQTLQAETGVPQIYFTGCGGNVAMGKYNTGTREDRDQLTGRLLTAMRQSSDQAFAALDKAGTAPPAEPSPRPVDTGAPVVVDVSSLSSDEIAWRSSILPFSPRREAEFQIPLLEEQLQADSPPAQRLKSAMLLAWLRRLQAGHQVDVTQLRLGPIQVVHLPGEPFVEYQLFAQQQAENNFVCVAGYGECGMWYFGPDSIFQDTGGYEQTWSFVGPCQTEVEALLKQLLGAR